MVVEDAARVLWELARDLASPRVSGTPLNSERAVKQLSVVIEAVAKAFAHDQVQQLQLKELVKSQVENNRLVNKLRQLKEQPHGHVD